jgi:peroxiredoxin
MVMDEITYSSINQCDTIPSRTSGIYYPAGFRLEVDSLRDRLESLQGDNIESWVLPNVNGDSVRLRAFKGRALLIEFTGVGCGPCGEALPFLKKLTGEYDAKEFKLVSIEIWEDDKVRLKKHLQENHIQHEYLIASNGTMERYTKFGIPLFLVVDKTNVINKVFGGYMGGNQENAIRAAINAVK